MQLRRADLGKGEEGKITMRRLFLIKKVQLVQYFDLRCLVSFSRFVMRRELVEKNILLPFRNFVSQLFVHFWRKVFVHFSFLYFCLFASVLLDFC